MSKSFYSIHDEQDRETGLWFDDGSFVVLMVVTWLALEGQDTGPWPACREHCYRQICIGGFGILDSGLDLLSPAERLHLAALLERFIATPTASVAVTAEGDDLDVSALDAELVRRGDGLAAEARPAVTFNRLDLLLPLVVRLLNGDAGGPVGAPESLAWFELWTAEAWGKGRHASLGD